MAILDKSLCRACAFESPQNEPLFLTETLLSNAGYLLAECLSVEISLNDGYPSSICNQCKNQLEAYAEFKTSVLRIHRHYTRRLKLKRAEEEHIQSIIKIEEDKCSVDIKTENKPSLELLTMEAEEFLDEDILDDQLEQYEMLEVLDDKMSVISKEEEIEYLIDDEIEDLKQEAIEIVLSPKSTHKSSDWFKCDKCGREYKHLHYLQMHICFNSKSPMFRCPICKMELNMAQIDSHLDQHPEYLQYRDNEEPIKRKTPMKLKMKSSKNLVRSQFDCNSCSGQFSSERALTYHICSNDDDKWRFRCDTCGKSFKAIACLNEHMMRHTGLRNYSCADCDKSFKTPADLYVHRKIHSGNLRKYICDICAYSCRSSSHLTNHLIIHSNERPFKCSMCDKTFKRKDMLDGHIRSLHTNKKDHACHVCQASFGLQQRLKRHLKIHIRKGEILETM